MVGGGIGNSWIGGGGAVLAVADCYIAANWVLSSVIESCRILFSARSLSSSVSTRGLEMSEIFVDATVVTSET
jgi:hypothetical protein